MQLANDGMALTLGEDSVKDHLVDRTQVFSTRDERLLAAVVDSLHQTVSVCAAPALSESLADTSELLERLQWASSAGVPAVNSVKQLLVSRSPLDVLLSSIFMPETIYTT